MMSINRQCDEALELLAKIQACVERLPMHEYHGGGLIPCRSMEFEIYIGRARQLLGVVDNRRRA